VDDVVNDRGGCLDLRLNLGLNRAPVPRDRGSTSLTAVVLTPVFVVIAFAAFQAAMWSHARTEARVMAREVAVLVVNRMRCPLTGVAARYTGDRAENFDIYLPLWLAKYNKEIFGTLFALGIVYTVIRWRLL